MGPDFGLERGNLFMAPRAVALARSATFVIPPGYIGPLRGVIVAGHDHRCFRSCSGIVFVKEARDLSAQLFGCEQLSR